MDLRQILGGFFIMSRNYESGTPCRDYARNYDYCFDRLLAHFGPNQQFHTISTEDIRHFVDHSPFDFSIPLHYISAASLSIALPIATEQIKTAWRNSCKERQLP